MLNNILESLRIKGICKAQKDNRHFRTYDVQLAPEQSIKRLESNVREIGLALRSHSIPILTTVPEEGIVRIQTTYTEQQTLDFDELYNRSIDSRPKGLLPFLLGEESSGDPIWLDIAKCPHMLVAGSTGSGKSVFLHTIIRNVEKRDDIQLYLVDPKHGIEFDKYKDLATLVVNDYEGTIKLLKGLVYEMEERYEMFKELGIRCIDESPYVVPKMLLIIDEAADLMLMDQDKKNPNRGLFEKLLIQLAQKARAVAIHIVMATQRPSVDVLTGLIKANFPARVACRVSSSTDSKVILDQAGAEHLIGRGDAIINADKFHCVRFQVASSGV